MKNSVLKDGKWVPTDELREELERRKIMRNNTRPVPLAKGARFVGGKQ